MRISLHRDIISGLLLVGISVWIWWQTSAFPKLQDGYPGPALFPQIIAILLAVAGLYLAAKGSRKKATTKSPSYSPTKALAGLTRLFIGLALAALYPVLIQYTHFIPVMAFLILFVALLLKNAAWHALLMSVLSAALIYSLFTQLLNVPL